MLVKLELLLNNEQMLMACSSPLHNAKPMLPARAFLSLVLSVGKLMENSGKIIQKEISGK